MEKNNCPAHDGIVRSIGAIEEAATTLKSQTSDIFDLLRSISEEVTGNKERALARDKAIAGIDRKIENGLRSDVRQLTQQMAAIMLVIERQREDRRSGIYGFFTAGWGKFKAQLGFIIITSCVVGGISLLLWGLSKVAIFHEGPLWLLKLFGIG
jgi:hypothetical protein